MQSSATAMITLYAYSLVKQQRVLHSDHSAADVLAVNKVPA